jgi:divalent metal cation (Fe/Co/Zn/Cd) transporter
MPVTPAFVSARRRRLAWWLTGATITWNSVEALTTLITGWFANSIALVGYGLDSIIEVSSALVIVWRLSHQSDDAQANQRAEQRSVRLIAFSFFAIAAYVSFDAFAQLVGLRARPDHSTLGLVIVTLSLVLMPSLAWAKRRVAAKLGSMALRADAAETQLCTYLSAVVLLGLANNALFGWWWMDSLAALVVAALALKEGRSAWTAASSRRSVRGWELTSR